MSVTRHAQTTIRALPNASRQTQRVLVTIAFPGNTASNAANIAGSAASVGASEQAENGDQMTNAPQASFYP